MTTTPDSRIRADWTLPAATAAPPPTVTPDTSTTAGKIAVMQAHARGEKIEGKLRNGVLNVWFSTDAGELVWDWKDVDYRIAPPPPARTALAEARGALRQYGLDHPPSLDFYGSSFVSLLREIDAAPLAIISMQTIGFGTEANPYPAIVQWVEGGPKAMQPGRYRLLRDDQ